MYIALTILLALVTDQASLRIEIRSDGKPVAGATVRVGTAVHVTGPDGLVRLPAPPGSVTIEVEHRGFAPAARQIVPAPGGEVVVTIDLEPLPVVEEEITVSATRTERRLDDQPMRVEVLQREEIEEKMLMTPGDIVMMLNEMGGMRVQATSPSLGAASVRVQGMRGRYTRFLSDGLPLFGEQPGGLGLLQVPPMDLGQVEVIKGVASALYGAGAMGGVVNLVSRRPEQEPQREVLVNRSVRGATDTVLWWSSPLSEKWGMSLLGGGHWQEQTDVDDDGWADLAGYSRMVVRPRVFWTGTGGRSVFATAGVTWEDRDGGTMDGAVLPQTLAPYQEELDTLRLDAGVVGQTIAGGRFVVTGRAAGSRQRHTHRFGTPSDRERDVHHTLFGEVAVRGAAGRHTWVAGAAIEHDRYDPEDVPRFAYSYTVPGVFVQDDVEIASWLTVSGSARGDFHSEYGAFLSPRLSALLRSGGWTARVSAGTGFFGPTALTEETEAAGLSRLTIPAPLRAERGRSASIDLTRSYGSASATVTLFASRVSHPIHVSRENDYLLTNLADPTRNSGVEVLGTLRRAPLAVTGSYAYVRSRETVDGLAADVALTPRHSAGVVAMIEAEDKGRLGLEVYFTGEQRLEANPYRSVSRPYVIVGLLGERRFGRWRVFVNGENLTGVKQTDWDPLLRPTRAADGRWTVDGWASLEGRNINAGLRVQF